MRDRDRPASVYLLRSACVSSRATPQTLFTPVGLIAYAPSVDGQRFLVNVPAGGQAAAASPITVVLNLTAGLKR
jgi:hypothetical protein